MQLNQPDSIFVAGHKGMVGSAIVSQLQSMGYRNILTAERNELDLTNQLAVRKFFSLNKISEIYMAAAKVGGIHANDTYPAEFIYENLMVECNVIHAAHLTGIQKILFLGSSCIYPRVIPQPMKEDALLQGPLEGTNEPYAIAKIAGIKLCESYNRQYGRDYRSVMPTNLYGPNDNFHPENSHVVPALLRRFHEASRRGDREVIIWGSGEPKREFLHVNDMATASILIMNLTPERYNSITEPRISHINVGSGTDCSIKELAETVAKVTGYHGKLMFDTSKPDGSPRKLLDITRLSSLGWKPKIGLEDGIRSAYKWFLRNLEAYRA